MEQSPSWDADRHPASQEIPCPLWNPKVHYRVRKSQWLFPTLSQMNPLHAFSSYFLNNHVNIIHPSKPGSSEWSLPFRFRTNILCAFLISPMRPTCPAHLMPLGYLAKRTSYEGRSWTVFIDLLILSRKDKLRFLQHRKSPNDSVCWYDCFIRLYQLWKFHSIQTEC
jgi:hypothetical protein